MYWRQWGSRYAIRAGRNLPDKEFRYLRTVIVTAAVYWGFNSELALLLLTFQHRAGVRPYTRSEEHTSELQSLMRISYAVFCLKKNHNIDRITRLRNQQPNLKDQTTT